MAEAGSIEIALRARVDRLEADLRKAEMATKKTSSGMKTNFKSVAASLKKVKGNAAAAAAVIVGLGTGAMANLAKEAIRTANDLGDTAQKLGISTSSLQEFQFAANQSGVRVEALNMGLQRFGRRAAEAANGTGEAKDAIKQLGIELKDGHGNLRTTEDLFTDAMTSLAAIENPLERVRLGFKLFDSEGVALVNMAENFGDLRAEAQSLGLVLDDEVIQRSGELQDSFDALSAITKGQLSGALTDLGGNALLLAAESMAELATWANKVYRIFADTENLGLSNMYLRQIEATEELEAAQEKLANRNAELNQTRNALAPSGQPAQMLLVERQTEEVDELIAELALLQDQIELTEKKREEAREKARSKSSSDGSEDTSGANQTEANRLSAMKKRADLAKRTHDEYLEQTGQQILAIQNQLAEDLAALTTNIEAEEDFTETKKKLRLNAASEINKIEEDRAQEAIDLAKDAADEIQKIEDKKAAKILKGVEERRDLEKRAHEEYLQASGQQILAVEEKLQADIAALSQNLEAHENYTDAIVELEQTAALDIKNIRDKEAKDLQDSLGEQNKLYEGLFEFMERGFSDAMATMLLDGELTFKTLAESFFREFVQMGISKLVASGFGQLADVFSSFGGINPATGGVNLAPGQTYGPVFTGPGAANGGHIGGPTLVGERGPELFIPSTSGFVANNNAMRQMSGSAASPINVTVVNNTGQESSTSEKDGAGGGRDIEVMIGKAITKNIARGGDVDQAIRSSYGVQRVGRHGL